MVVSPRCLERGANPSTPSHHQCEGRPPARQASRAQRAINGAAASAACLAGGPGPLPHLLIALRVLRDLIEESGHVADSPILEDREIRALDRAVDAVGAKPPGEADVVAISVGLADQPEFEIGKALLHAGNQGVDAVMAVA